MSQQCEPHPFAGLPHPVTAERAALQQGLGATLAFLAVLVAATLLVALLVGPSDPIGPHWLEIAMP
jgi:hypothetical protein